LSRAAQLRHRSTASSRVSPAPDMMASR
jgi:hypothetical protein